MPKIVDHERRRDAIADALFEVIRDGGFSKVSLATVADRAGLVIGSVRHFVGSREDMIRFAFDTAAARIHERILARSRSLLDDLEAGGLDADARAQATVDLLCELLPLDERRRDEAIVWIELETAARTDVRLAETSERATAQLTHLIETILQSMSERGALPPDAALDVETARLAALLDGLTVRGVLHPHALTSSLAREVVAAHLRQLRAP